MTLDDAKSIALRAIVFILSEEDLQGRFLALSGLSKGEMRSRIDDQDFLVGVLDFLVNFEPDLLAFSSEGDIGAEHIVRAWRTLGGGAGQEW